MKALMSSAQTTKDCLGQSSVSILLFLYSTSLFAGERIIKICHG